MPEALRDELLKKIKRIEITTRKMVSDVMSGQYRSHFKGHGVQFSEHRLYVPGDDVRHIDWKASARSKDSLVKKYEEERELTVFLIVDVSGSESFGSAGRLKSEVVAELASMVAYAAVLTGDRVGALLFTSQVEKIVPPKKGRQHVLRIVHDLLTYRPEEKGTNLAVALEAAGRIMKHAGVVFVLSDFQAAGYERELQRLARKHDVVAIQVGDERERKIVAGDTFLFTDPESGKEAFIDTASYSFRKWFGEFTKGSATRLDDQFKKMGIESVSVLTKEDYGEAIVRFFQKRRRR